MDICASKNMEIVFSLNGVLAIHFTNNNDDDFVIEIFELWIAEHPLIKYFKSHISAIF